MRLNANACGLPDLPLRAFVRHGRNIRPQGKGDTPATPDYAGAATATAEGNLEAAKYATQANRANQYTPWGNLTWTNDRQFNQSAYDAAMDAYNQQLAAYNSQTQAPADGQNYTNPNDYGYMGPWETSQNRTATAPTMPNAQDYYAGGDNWTQTITLSPEMQSLLDQQNKLQQGLFGAQDAALGRVNQTMGQGFDISGLPQGGQALNMGALPGFGEVYDPNLATNNATELLMQRINPQLDRQNEALRAQLANQGITQGSSAYANAMNQFGQQRNDAATQAALQGIGLGMQQQGLQFGQQTTNQQLAAALQGQQFGQSEQARQRAMAEQAYLRNLPLNELNALRTGNQVSMPQFPGYGQQATTGGADMLGAAQNTYNAQLGAANASNASSNSVLGGLFGIGGAILGAPSTSILGKWLT